MSTWPESLLSTAVSNRIVTDASGVKVEQFVNGEPRKRHTKECIVKFWHRIHRVRLAQSGLGVFHHGFRRQLDHSGLWTVLDHRQSDHYNEQPDRHIDAPSYRQ